MSSHVVRSTFVLILDVLPEVDFVRVDDFAWYHGLPTSVTIVKVGPQLTIAFEGASPGSDDELSELVLTASRWGSACLGAVGVLIAEYQWNHHARNLLELAGRIASDRPLSVRHLSINPYPRTGPPVLPQHLYRYLDVATSDPGLYRGMISLFRAGSVPEEAPIFLYRAVEAAVRSAAGRGDEASTSKATWEAGYQRLSVDPAEAQPLMEQAQDWRHPGKFSDPIPTDPPFVGRLRRLARRSLARLAKLRDPSIMEPKSLLESSIERQQNR